MPVFERAIPYTPDALPLECLDFKRLFGVAGKANAALAKYDGLLSGIVNPTVMLAPLLLEEATLSSKIEGTQATVTEVLEHAAGLKKTGEKALDIVEILNYRMALSEGQAHLETFPITLSFVRELHKVLLSGVRGEDKTPGSFRKNQNWIGRPGSPMEEASFIPPSPLTLEDHLRDWQTYLESQDIDPLVQTAVMHAQFELIHPFRDGNGRIGRILIPLFLFQKKRLSTPMFYLSGYLEKNRSVYYERLTGISRDGDWNGWIEFFLNAVEAQAEENAKKAIRIITLYNKMKRDVQELLRSPYAITAIDDCFFVPIFQATDFVNRTGLHKPTAMRILGKMRDAGFLEELAVGRGRTSSVFHFSPLLNITEGLA